MVYRLRASDLGQPSMILFASAMRRAQSILDNRSYNTIAGFHGAPGWYCWHHQFNPRTAIQARLFLPWHRAYLWWLEQALQDQVEGAALPWWDWTSVREVPPAYTADTFDGQGNPLERYRIRIAETVNNPRIDRETRRNPGQAGRLPSSADVADLLDNEPDFASFSDTLQRYHDGVHVWVGGDMSDPTTAGFDPIFYAHHCMIDRIWYLWQIRNGPGNIPNGLLDLVLVPFNKRVRDVLDIQALGYEYAVTATEIPVGG